MCAELLAADGGQMCRDAVWVNKDTGSAARARNAVGCRSVTGRRSAVISLQRWKRLRKEMVGILVGWAVRYGCGEVERKEGESWCEWRRGRDGKCGVAEKVGREVGECVCGGVGDEVV